MNNLDDFQWVLEQYIVTESKHFHKGVREFESVLITTGSSASLLTTSMTVNKTRKHQSTYRRDAFEKLSDHF